MRQRVDYETVTQHWQRAAYVKLPNALKWRRPFDYDFDFYKRGAWKPFQTAAKKTHALEDWRRVPKARAHRRTSIARTGAYVESA